MAGVIFIPILFPLLLRIAVVGAVLFTAWKVVKPKWAFTIAVDQSGVRSHKGIKTPQQHRLLDMFRKTRFVEGPVTIRGRYDENGKLQLQFSGTVSPDTQQQIRNFVVNEF